ncbi:MAG TPA: hemolysin III family protein [Nitrospirota bacterium]|nr:hemolysin III family protein [Nitrospirota bacterium]
MYRGERLNSITHLIGTTLAIAGLVVLVVHAAQRGDPWRTVSFSIYGVTLVALYFFSTLYHITRGKVKAIFQTLDHAAIYLLIAGTYTPFTLVTLRGIWGWWLFGTIWGLALIGMLQDLLSARRRSILSIAIYLLMGWFVVVAIRPLAQALPVEGLIGMVAGGLFYTVGVVFYVLGKRFSYGHGIFHLFVMAGSACHYFTILLHVA